MKTSAATELCTIALAATLIAGASVRGAPAETVTLEMPVAYGTHLPGLGTPALALAKALEERSGGALRLDVKQPGEGTLPHEILDKVSDGKVDAGFATASFWAAKVPASSLFGGFPFGPDAKGYLAWFDRGNGRKLYQEMYDQAKLKVHVIPCAFGGAEAGGWFAKEIKTKKDLEGLRMRIFGLGARAMSRLGVVPVLVPGGDLPKAFDKGEIEAAELYTPSVDQAQGVQEAAKLIYVPGWHQPETVFELLINKDRWNALTPDRQELIEQTCREMLQSTLAESATLQAAALAALSTKHSVRVLPWPDDVLEALRNAWAEIAREEGTRDYFFKEVFDDIKKFEAGSKAVPPESVPEGSTPADQKPADR